MDGLSVYSKGMCLFFRVALQARYGKRATDRMERLDDPPGTTSPRWQLSGDGAVIAQASDAIFQPLVVMTSFARALTRTSLGFTPRGRDLGHRIHKGRMRKRHGAEAPPLVSRYLREGPGELSAAHHSASELAQQRFGQGAVHAGLARLRGSGVGS